MTPDVSRQGPSLGGHSELSRSEQQLGECGCSTQSPAPPAPTAVRPEAGAAPLRARWWTAHTGAGGPPCTRWQQLTAPSPRPVTSGPGVAACAVVCRVEGSGPGAPPWGGGWYLKRGQPTPRPPSPTALSGRRHHVLRPQLRPEPNSVPDPAPVPLQPQRRCPRGCSVEQGPQVRVPARPRLARCWTARPGSEEVGEAARRAAASREPCPDHSSRPQAQAKASWDSGNPARPPRALPAVLSQMLVS